jgi:hypothetical protein
VEGKISNETFEEWNRETGGATLPERLRPRTKAKTTKSPRSKTKARAKRKAGPKRRKRQ